MASSSQLCEPCFRATQSSVAVKYCSDCDESLCSDCFSIHGTFKAFISHHVIDAHVSADISFELNKFCSDHIDMVLDFYCSDHDDICCKSCIADEHRICEKIKPLDVAAKGVKSAIMFEDFASEVKYLIDTASKVREQKQKSKVTWDSSTDSVKRGVEIFRCRILKHIDDMEEKLMLKVNAANSIIVAETGEGMKAVEKYMSDIQDISHKFDFITKNGSEKQIFRLIKTLETGLSQKSEDLEKLISSLTFPQLVFKESNLLSKMETIGSVTIETSPSDMNYQPPKALQAQSKNRAIKPAIQSKFEFDSKIPNAEKHDFRKFKPHKRRHNQHKEAHDKDGMGRRFQYEEAHDKDGMGRRNRYKESHDKDGMGRRNRYKEAHDENGMGRRNRYKEAHDEDGMGRRNRYKEAHDEDGMGRRNRYKEAHDEDGMGRRNRYKEAHDEDGMGRRNRYKEAHDEDSMGPHGQRVQPCVQQ